MNILITGGAGFIGANFVHYWRNHMPDDTIVILDNLSYAGNKESIASVLDTERSFFVHGDICDFDLVKNILLEYDITHIVNFAAETHVDRSIHGPDAFVRTNITGTHTLLKAARNVWMSDGTDGSTIHETHRFHHVSTDEVYGTLGFNDPAFTEDTPYAPNSPYSASKAGSDHLVRAYFHTYGLPVTISNCSNNYGPYQYPEKLIPLMIINMLQGKKLPIYGDGKNIRDWLFVEDHCRGIEAILRKGRLGETYNVGGECEKDNLSLVRVLCGLMDELSPESACRPHDSLITYVKDRPGHDRRYAINIAKIRSELDFSPSVSFEEGIKKTITWYIEHREWWARILGGEEYSQWVATQYKD